MKSWLLVVIFAMTCFGCHDATTAMGRAAGRLKPGMKKAEVEQVFSEFDGNEGDFRESSIFEPTKLFQTNIPPVMCLSYIQGVGLLGFEGCWVYFDTNQIIVGYKYSFD